MRIYCHEPRSTSANLASGFYLCATTAAHKQQKRNIIKTDISCTQLAQANFGEGCYFFHCFSLCCWLLFRKTVVSRKNKKKTKTRNILKNNTKPALDVSFRELETASKNHENIETKKVSKKYAQRVEKGSKLEPKWLPEWTPEASRNVCTRRSATEAAKNASWGAPRAPLDEFEAVFLPHRYPRGIQRA